MIRATILLQKVYVVRELGITDGATTSLPGEKTLTVTIRPFTDEETKVGYSRGAMAITQWQCDVPPKAMAALEDLAAGKLHTVEHGQRLFPNFHDLPAALQAFAKHATHDVFSRVRSFVFGMRWRLNMWGPHNPFSGGALRWSLDGTDWKPFPEAMTVRVGDGGSCPRLSQRVTELTEVAAGLEEPLHHNLFREAWSQRATNPRSSLIVGVAAAEIAVKSTLVWLAPSAEWFILNVQSPPLEKMLQSALPAALKAVGKNVRFLCRNEDDEVLKMVRAGVTERNTQAHRPSAPPNVDRVERVLLALRDVLYMCDVYAGHEWALDRIRAETLAAWVSN